MTNEAAPRQGISLVEILVVVVIVGVLAAMAIPRFSRAAQSPETTVLRENLAILRTAIDLYYQDHRAYPGQITEDESDAGRAAAFVAQLTKFSNADGDVADQPRAGFRFGPYLRNGVPPCPVAVRADARDVFVICGAATPGFAAGAGSAGWVFNCETGSIAANSDRTDEGGVRFDRY